jgi:hypothetical protein
LSCQKPVSTPSRLTPSLPKAGNFKDANSFAVLERWMAITPIHKEQ